jgi:hypothetical protein
LQLLWIPASLQFTKAPGLLRNSTLLRCSFDDFFLAFDGLHSIIASCLHLNSMRHTHRVGRVVAIALLQGACLLGSWLGFHSLSAFQRFLMMISYAIFGFIYYLKKVVF